MIRTLAALALTASLTVPTVPPAPTCMAITYDASYPLMQDLWDAYKAEGWTAPAHLPDNVLYAPSCFPKGLPA